MKFSIIIPVYNVEDKLSRCLDSILNQDYRDYEIILVNDGSKDNSAEVCKKYSDKYEVVKYIDKENGGASSARNTGLENAKGEFILFVDSEDYVNENYFDVLDRFVINEGLAVFTYRLITNKADYIIKIPSVCLDTSSDLFTISKSLILSRTINSLYAKIFDRNVIEINNLRFDEKMPVAEDFNFCLDYLMNCNKVTVYYESVYVYDNTNVNSLVNSKKEGLIDIYPYVFDTAYKTIDSSEFNITQKEELFKIWDKLHTDSFITCVIEELKGVYSVTKKINNIRDYCKKYYEKYSTTYGYVNIIHFSVRMCIRLRLAVVLYCLSFLYARLKK